ncbi:MAG: arsenate reductase (glutaredoxin) [Sphingomonadales bacterium 32-68-7]|nr:MAG: arsenate reductase (glutaredoxin) [Sphingomonadales bacterium 12-68-11]OYX08506.1 MAG: arsenate reductase (glutaredoxin) [Sphingomonadales bacterium 32-68-7]
MDVTIYHNPRCGTSRAALGLIRDAGIEPRVIEYLKTPLDRAELSSLTARMGVPVRTVVRAKEALYAELGLDAADDDALLGAMIAYPILMNRPIVVTPKGAALCRPSDAVLGLL